MFTDPHDTVRVVFPRSWDGYTSRRRTHLVYLVCGHCGQERFMGRIEHTKKKPNLEDWIAYAPDKLGGMGDRRKLGRKKYQTIASAVQALVDYHGLPKYIFRNVPIP